MNGKLLIASILLVGLVIRVFFLFRATPFAADTARDLLMGYHIAKFHEIPTIGHSASGNSFVYLPYYYYLLGLINIFSTNPHIIIFIFTIWQSTSIILTYKIAESILDRTAGIIAALSVTLGSYFVTTHTWLYSGLLATPFILFAFYCFFKKMSSENTIYLYCLIFSLTVGSFFSYVSLVFLPIFFLCFFFISKKGGLVNFVIKLAVFTLFSLILSILPLYIFFGTSLLSAFNPYDKFQLNGTRITNFFVLLNQFFHEFFPTLSSIPSAIFFVLFITGLFFLFQKSRKTFYKVGLLSISIFYLIILTALKRGIVSLHYFDVLYPLLVIKISVVFSFWLNVNRKLIPRFVTFALLALFFFYVSNEFRYLFLTKNDFRNSKNKVELNLKSSEAVKRKNNFVGNYDFFQIYNYQPEESSWSSTISWYFWETITGNKIVKIIPTANNFLPITSNQFVYLWCKEYTDALIDDQCMNDFTLDKGNYIKFETIYSDVSERIFLLQKKNNLSLYYY